MVGAGSDVAGLDGDQLGGGAVPVAVDEAVHLVTDGHAGRAVAEPDHDARELVARDQRRTVVPGAVGEDRPEQLARREAAGVDLDEDVTDRRLRVGRVLVDETVDADGGRDADRFHDLPSRFVVPSF